jgi:hypothetical protein
VFDCSLDASVDGGVIYILTKWSLLFFSLVAPFFNLKKNGRNLKKNRVFVYQNKDWRSGNNERGELTSTLNSPKIVGEKNSVQMNCWLKWN